MQLPAQLAHIVDPHGLERHPRQRHLPGVEEGEGGVGEIGVAQALQQVPGPGAGDHEDAEGVGQIIEADSAVFRHEFMQVVMIQPLPGGGGHQIKGVFPLAADRVLRMHPAAPVEGVAQAHLAVLGRQAIGEHPV